MIKKAIISISILLSLSPLLLLAESDLKVPASIQQNCLVTPEWGIDYCPKHWEVLAEKNEKLANLRQSLANSWSLTQLTALLDNNIAGFIKKKVEMVRQEASSSDLFMLDYELYISKLFRHYIEWNSDSKQIVSSFFKRTYYNNDQSWLLISNIKLYKWVNQYDKSITTQIKIRNYAQHTIDNIEDIYCFTTILSEDFIFPLGVQTVFAKNSITTLVVDIPTQTTDLLNSYGNKKLFCTLVYTQDNKEKYSNWWILDFDLKG